MIYEYSVTIETDNAAYNLPGYIRFRPGAAEETIELVRGDVFADYDKDGLLLGVEFLGPEIVNVEYRLEK